MFRTCLTVLVSIQEEHLDEACGIESGCFHKSKAGAYMHFKNMGENHP